jgi:hypothetical protein
VFARNETTRLALVVLRDAGEPLGVAAIAVRVLAVRGLPTTDQEDDAGATPGGVLHGAREAQGQSGRLERSRRLSENSSSEELSPRV